jgi:hypothetical protein
MTQLNANEARCEAPFASELQPSDAPTAEIMAKAIDRIVQKYGIGGRAVAWRPWWRIASRQRETVFAAVMADRPEWEAATRQQRHLMAVAADAELRRRHPGQYYAPLRSAEPRPATSAQRAELTLTTGEKTKETVQWLEDLAARRRTFADRLADRQSQTIPSEDPDYGDLGQAFPPWRRPAREAILQPPIPEIPPSPRIGQHATDRDADWEAAD